MCNWSIKAMSVTLLARRWASSSSKGAQGGHTATAVVDPFALLGVPKSATKEQLKAAFRQRALELHPDVQRGTVADPALFIRLTEAYEQALAQHGTQHTCPSAPGSTTTSPSPSPQAPPPPPPTSARTSQEARKPKASPLHRVRREELLQLRYGVGSWLVDLQSRASMLTHRHPKAADDPGSALEAARLAARARTLLAQYRSDLELDLGNALVHAYLGPRLRTHATAPLPAAFQAEQRTDPAASPDILHLVWGRTLLGRVSTQPPTDWTHLTAGTSTAHTPLPPHTERAHNAKDTRQPCMLPGGLAGAQADPAHLTTRENQHIPTDAAQAAHCAVHSRVLQPAPAQPTPPAAHPATLEPHSREPVSTTRGALAQTTQGQDSADHDLTDVGQYGRLRALLDVGRYLTTDERRLLARLQVQRAHETWTGAMHGIPPGRTATGLTGAEHLQEARAGALGGNRAGRQWRTAHMGVPGSQSPPQPQPPPQPPQPISPPTQPPHSPTLPQSPPPSLKECVQQSEQAEPLTPPVSTQGQHAMGLGDSAHCAEPAAWGAPLSTGQGARVEQAERTIGPPDLPHAAFRPAQAFSADVSQVEAPMSALRAVRAAGQVGKADVARPAVSDDVVRKAAESADSNRVQEVCVEGVDGNRDRGTGNDGGTRTQQGTSRGAPPVPHADVAQPPPVTWPFDVDSPGATVLYLTYTAAPSDVAWAVLEPAQHGADVAGPGARVKVYARGRLVVGVSRDLVLSPLTGIPVARVVRGGSLGLHVLHVFDYTSPTIRLLARAYRPQLPHQSTWLFPPRLSSHAHASSWSVEWSGYRRRAYDRGWMDPCVHVFLAAVATLRMETQLAGTHTSEPGGRGAGAGEQANVGLLAPANDAGEGGAGGTVARVRRAVQQYWLRALHVLGYWT